ncbi:MAG: glycosyltransferase, partial [Actinomycetota bacterium]|nr:glycosyltransferase [Actinomycetota bacterium]
MLGVHHPVDEETPTVFNLPDIPRRRVALYSHDTQGLGHIRRNLAIATALAAAEPAPEILIISGAPGAGALPLPPGTDCLTLPALGKRADGSYQPRSLAASLGALTELRSRIIQAALTSFDPDLLIVDKVPWGACGELEPALADLRSRGKARCVLGLRDVLDSPDVARREWRQQRATEAVTLHYDAVWIYGDPSMFDLVADCSLPPVVARRVTYTGYLGHRRPATLAAPIGAVPSNPFALCLVGGGQDGLDVARAFVQAGLPYGRSGVVLTGPYMTEEDRSVLHRCAADRSDMVVAGFVGGAEHLVAAAESVVSMGGYNSVCELLASGKRALIVPRARPRAEQLVRAARLAEHGLV